MHGAAAAEQGAADMVVAGDVPGFEDQTGHQVASSKLTPEMVGSRSPVAFSGSAESSARV